MTEHIQQAIDALRDLEEDQDIPKNTKNKISQIITDLNEEAETSMKISRALASLEEISEETNLQSFARMQLFNVAGLLEQK